MYTEIWTHKLRTIKIHTKYIKNKKSLQKIDRYNCRNNHTQTAHI